VGDGPAVRSPGLGAQRSSLSLGSAVSDSGRTASGTLAAARRQRPPTDDIVAAISHERGGHTVLVLAQATSRIVHVDRQRGHQPGAPGPRGADRGARAAAPDDLPLRRDRGDHRRRRPLAGRYPDPPVGRRPGARDRDRVGQRRPGPRRSQSRHARLRAAALARRPSHPRRRRRAALRRARHRRLGRRPRERHLGRPRRRREPAALRHLAGVERVDAARVGLLGHSEGSVIVGRVAAAFRTRWRS
jgi:hypothetical protein